MAQDRRAPLMQRGIVDFFIAHDLLSARLEKALKSADLNLTQMSLLNHFSHCPEKAHSISGLAKVMGINQPGVTKAVNALIDKKCLVKKESSEDARVKMVSITASGSDRLNEARAACYPFIEHTFEVLSDEELEHFAALINKLKKHLDAQRG